MILFVGPLYSGKEAAAKAYFAAQGNIPDDLVLVRDVPAIFYDHPSGLLSEDELAALADRYADADAVLFTETGSGLIPTAAAERAARENAGRLAQLLADRAEEVYRVFCGIPKRLK